MRVGRTGTLVFVGALLLHVALGCTKPRPDTAGGSSAASVHSAGTPNVETPPEVQQAWARAKDGDDEDRVVLADREGAVGLVEATRDPSRRRTALMAMGKARGFAQLPFLVSAARGSDDEDAKLGLEAALELANRPRTSEDLEDGDELRQGCEDLYALCTDTKASRGRRVAALRAWRLLPCARAVEAGAIPSDLDAK
jgi:hypothetical protein